VELSAMVGNEKVLTQARAVVLPSTAR
jgi:hypothetical protein